ncbi:MAG TPA: SAM-dependent DNA methyltransferase [Xanthobacteraceae bacterium]|nr:SAM-dependent DNA methyltransferase [Xanthobacteraceae bacterium]
MTAPLPFGGGAVMNRRVEPPDSLDFFPTPPWATRALCEIVLGVDQVGGRMARDPACGEGHMVETLAEYYPQTGAGDIHDYGAGYAVQDYRTSSPVVAPGAWTITNPPYNSALEFALHALSAEEQGLALLVRTNWLEGETRFAELFAHRPPNAFHQFAERVPMFRGRYEPEGSTATAYGWAVWMPGRAARRDTDTRLRWIPPCKDYLFRPEDVRRWCAPAPAPLFEGAP